MFSALADLYRSQVYDAGKQPLFLLLVSFLLGFAFIRTSTRLIRAQVRWWPGNVEPGGLHIHHVVFGVVFMLGAGVGSFTTVGDAPPWQDIFACLFGLGSALVLDEFALILHLKDVYWTQEGRTSVDAVILAAALCGLLLVGSSPLGVKEETEGEITGWPLFALVLFNLVLVLITFARGKLWIGAIGLFVPVVALVGAIRLAKPGSPWAKLRYKAGSKKLARAEARQGRVQRRSGRMLRGFGDLIAGRPSTGQGND